MVVHENRLALPLYESHDDATSLGLSNFFAPLADLPTSLSMLLSGSCAEGTGLCATTLSPNQFLFLASTLNVYLIPAGSIGMSHAGLHYLPGREPFGQGAELPDTPGTTDADSASLVRTLVQLHLIFLPPTTV